VPKAQEVAIRTKVTAVRSYQAGFYGGADISMKIKIRPIGLIKRYAEDSEIEIEAGLTPRKLIADLGIPAELKMVSFVNGTRVDLDHELHDGDEVKLVTLVTGG
jgi:sulfur carrier protein ThiS